MHYDPLTERCSECDRRVCICEPEEEKPEPKAYAFDRVIAETRERLAEARAVVDEVRRG